MATSNAWLSVTVKSGLEIKPRKIVKCFWEDSFRSLLEKMDLPEETVIDKIQISILFMCFQSLPHCLCVTSSSVTLCAYILRQLREFQCRLLHLWMHCKYCSKSLKSMFCHRKMCHPMEKNWGKIYSSIMTSLVSQIIVQYLHQYSIVVYTCMFSLS